MMTMGSSPFWQQPETGAGNASEWRPVGATPQAREINRINERVRAVHMGGRMGGSTLSPE